MPRAKEADGQSILIIFRGGTLWLRGYSGCGHEIAKVTLPRVRSVRIADGHVYRCALHRMRCMITLDNLCPRDSDPGILGLKERL